MIVLPPLLMHLVDEDNSVKPKLGRNLAYSFLNSVSYTFFNKTSTLKDKSICKDHDHEILRPHLTSTWMPNAIGSEPGKSVIFAEAEVIWRENRIQCLILMISLVALCFSDCARIGSNPRVVSEFNLSVFESAGLFKHCSNEIDWRHNTVHSETCSCRC